MEQQTGQQKAIAELFDYGFLLSKDLLEKTVHEDIFKKIETEEDLIILTSDYVDILSQQSSLVDWYEIDSYRVESERGHGDLYQQQLQKFKTASLLLQSSSFQQQQEVSSLETALDVGGHNSTFGTSAVMEIPAPSLILPENLSVLQNYPVTIVASFQNKARKYDVKHFTSFFASRYRFLEGLLRHRQELEQVLPISRILIKKERESVAAIGLVDEIAVTKNGNLMLTLEDLTGKIKILVSQNKKELHQLAKDLIFDEVVGITGVSGDKIIFAENIVWPDIPNTHELKKSPQDECAIFLSDIHVGSALFLHGEFQRFLSWIRGEAGNESQKSIAAKVKYVIIAGDLVDGVGIYPSQEEELAIKDIYKQYLEFARLIQQIPGDKQIIMCPGNHDVVHLAEPQSVFYKEYALPLFSLPNVTLVSNPAWVTIGKTKNFSGLDLLLYHGYSFDYYVNNVESIRNNGGYHRADLIMKFLLKRRHLAPSFRSTPYFPAYDDDPLLITKIPDLFVTGHIHYSKVANYKGITMISGSCWQGKTTFQEKLGHEPEPARVPLVNLQTREVKILRFI